MAATFGSIVDEVIHNLQGFSAKTDALATLEAPIDANTTQVKLDDTAGFSRGVVQVGDELMYVNRTDPSSGQLVVPPWGRGFKGTPASAHAAGEMVTMAPTWPRFTVAHKVNESIRELYPALFAVKTLRLTSEASRFTHSLPADAQRVLGVRARVPGTVSEWERVRHYDVLWGQDPDEYATGASLSIFDALVPGTPVLVTYAAEPQVLTDPADEFAATTGLHESVASLIALGATVKLLPYLDAARIPVETVASDEADSPRPMGSAAQTAQTFLRLYQIRLEEERRALSDRYPAQYRRTP